MSEVGLKQEEGEGEGTGFYERVPLRGKKAVLQREGERVRDGGDARYRPGDYRGGESMRIYRETWRNNKEGDCVDWAASKAEAKSILAGARRDAKNNGQEVEALEVEAVEFKPTKADILRLLRRTPGHGNG